ncbi:phosphate signaling complex protein PhoU [Xanthobacter autotrophicus]|jgi:phosphate transport system protein|uniref:Phosphate-specific transport system accessory protein PhoU n=1 Tax=Xanthobacter autotrophicus TaxID=280 RepID=A0A6C1KD18_XANAU|nr:phosphate signaling complex protein PhoU [Xanthobacter autotrophicus]MDI4656340.1 phosphate signaling complex protein PhoU [Xanthobacter autotrophicus]TLX42178.1 phosphate signaling complex protein PhoU [Xanthobacter autotrophicus]
MPEHTVSSFDQELKEIGRKVVEMGGLAERLVADSVSSLIKRDGALAQKVVLLDTTVDQMQREIEDRAILVIAKRQPVANDLREIVSAIRIANDLERIGDLAKNVGKRVMAIEGEYHPAKLVRGVEHISDLVLEQLKEVLDAYAARNEAKAVEVWGRDSAIDTMYTSLFRELLTYMMEDPRNISVCTHLLFCAKNIERIGDHATNVAEIVYYMVTGQNLPESRPKADASSETTLAFPGRSAQA